MSSFFSIESPLFNAINKICDVVLLSILYCVLCLPIITIGPATTALYYAVVKVIRRERGYLYKEFFRSFKMNFKSGCFVTIILAVAFLILRVDLSYAKGIAKTNESWAFILKCFFNALLLVLAMITVYIFPILSRFTVKGKQLFKNAFFMSIRHLPSTIILLIIVGAAGFILYIIPVTFFVVPVLTCLLVSLLFERIFKKYMPPKNELAEEEGTDEWYWE